MKEKGKSIKIALSVVILIAVVGVCLGVKLYNTDDTVMKDTNKDLLAGVFVTTRPVEADEEQDNTEHYATLVENTITSETGEKMTEYTYVFEDLEGYNFFSFYYDDGEKNFWSGVYDEVFTSAKVHLGKERILSANLIHNLYDTNVTFNPVYQKKDGSIYTVLNGFGYSHGIGTPGFSIEEKFSDEVIRFKEGRIEKTSTYIEINLDGRTAIPETIEIQEMKDDGECISKKSYVPEEFPDVIKMAEDADYVLVRTIYDDGEYGKYSERETVGKDDESFKTFHLDDNRIFREKITFIEW